MQAQATHYIMLIDNIVDFGILYATNISYNEHAINTISRDNHIHKPLFCIYSFDSQFLFYDTFISCMHVILFLVCKASSGHF